MWDVASRYDPMTLVGAALGAATIALSKPKKAITPAQMLGNMCAAFACGYFAPEAVAAYYPQAEKFMGLAAFLSAVVGVAVTTKLVQRVPEWLDRVVDRRLANLGDNEDREDTQASGETP